jgi:hypothetical protein
MKRKLPLAIIPIALLVTVALVLQGDSPAEVPAEESSADAAAKAAGMMLYVDPDTGEYLEPSPGSFPIDVAYDDSYSTDDWGLVEEAAPKGGGTMVNLQGRFMNTYTAKVDDSGDLNAGCDLHKHVEKAKGEKEGE